MVKRALPFILAALGIVFVIISQVLKNGTADADAAITNLSSLFMLIAGIICIIVGIVTFLHRHDPHVW